MEITTYLEKLSKDQRSVLEEVRRLIKSAAPEAVEVISYGMPAFKFKGKYLVGYAAFKDHFSLFPTPGPIEALTKDLSEFTLSKGTIQFTREHLLPDELIQRLVAKRLEEIGA